MLTILFGMAVMLNIVPILMAWFQAGNSEGRVMKMIGSRWFSVVPAAALSGSSVLSSVVANAAPV
ncbi:hypothetical protein [Nocardia niwae]|uniref:hypothetical protein n=1 Tax=Nocardia niwae TaxID=626084 RepID=UPI0012F4A820|nr:hypothetical protein [Nocardia niwae]